MTQQSKKKRDISALTIENFNLGISKKWFLAQTTSDLAGWLLKNVRPEERIKFWTKPGRELNKRRAAKETRREGSNLQGKTGWPAEGCHQQWNPDLRSVAKK
jgi:hypothetical protein